jgi:hypothetical protein
MAPQNNTENNKKLQLKNPLYVKKNLIVYAITLLQWEYGVIDLHWNSYSPQANFFNRNQLFICEKPNLLGIYPENINLLITFPDRRAKEITLLHILKKISRVYRRELPLTLLNQLVKQENIDAFHNCLSYCLSGVMPDNQKKIKNFPITHLSKGPTARDLFSKDHLRIIFWDQFITTGNDFIGSYWLLLNNWIKKQKF